MKKLLAFLMAACMMLGVAGALAEVDFDPAAYAEAELREIVSKINLHLDALQIKPGDVLYDKDGVYVEFRGMEEYYSSGYYLKIFVRNDTDEKVNLYLSKAYVDRAILSRSNADASIDPHALYVSSTGNHCFILYTDVLEDYGIEHGTNFESSFILTVGEEKHEFDLNLVVDMVPR